MKNLFRLTTKFLACFLLLFISHKSYAVVTGTISVEQFQNTSSTANSAVTFQIVLSNGWTGYSSISSLILKNDAGTTVYTHPGGSSTIPYGTITNLAVGHYKFTTTVNTRESDNVTPASVYIEQDMWVGNKVLWENCFDMEQGASQYSIKRSKATSGQAYSYAQSFNSLASGTAGWVEMSKLAYNMNDSHIFWILEPLADPRSFSPSDNISYIEFFYTNSSSSGIKVKYKKVGGAWQTDVLSATLTDKIRFSRASGGTCILQKNSSTSTLFTFPVNITGAIKITVLGKQVLDQADQINTSFAYPSTDYPFTTTFNSSAHTNTGTMTVRIAPLSGYTSPYNYFLSDMPIVDMKTAYKYFKDTLYPDIDSTSFFTGSTALTTYTSNETGSGTYYAAAFDSKGVRIYGNTYDVSPPVTYQTSSNIANSYNEFVSTAPGSYATFQNYLSDYEDGKVIYYLSDISNKSAFGLLATGDNIHGGANLYSNIRFGFYVDGGYLYPVIGGSLGSAFSAKTGVPIELSLENGNAVFRSEGSVITSTALSGASTYKSGVIFNKWGTRIRITGVLISHLPFLVLTEVLDNACGKATGDIRITYPTTGFHGGTVTGMSLQLKNVTDETNVFNVGSVNTTLFDDIPLGVYSLEGSITVNSVSYTIKRLIYLGSKFSWENYANIESWSGSNTHYAVATGAVSPSLPAKAISSNKLAPGTPGWAVVTPRSQYVNGMASANTTFTLNEAPQMNALVIDPSMPSIVFYGGVAYVVTWYNSFIQLFSPLNGYTPNTPTLVARYANGTVKYRQNYSVLKTVTGYLNGRWKPAMLGKVPSAGLINCLSSFQCAPATTDIYAQLKYDLDGYYHIMKNGQIRFVFNQEYNTADLQFNLYNSSDQLYRTQVDFPALTTTNGMNYLTLDVTGSHCIGSGFFYLEVINSKNEKMYLRFHNDYTGCIPTQEGEGEDPEGH